MSCLAFCLASLFLVAQPAEMTRPPLAATSPPTAEDSLILLLGGDTSAIGLYDPQTRAVRQAQRGMPGKSDAIKVGEKLVFSVRYGIIRAGEASMMITGIEEIDGYPCYHVVSRAKSNSFFDKIFKVRDTVESWMDVDFLYSRRFQKSVREGGYRNEQRVEMDQENRLASYENGEVYEFAAGAHDILSAFYYVRTLTLQPGQEFWLEAHTDRKNYPLKVVVLRRETVDTPAGTFNCLVIEPTLRTSGLFKQEGKLTIWLTDDRRRMPVLMKSKIAIGSITVVMTDYERPE